VKPPDGFSPLFLRVLRFFVVDFHWFSRAAHCDLKNPLRQSKGNTGGRENDSFLDPG